MHVHVHMHACACAYACMCMYICMCTGLQGESRRGYRGPRYLDRGLITNATKLDCGEEPMQLRVAGPSDDRTTWSCGVRSAAPAPRRDTQCEGGMHYEAKSLGPARKTHNAHPLPQDIAARWFSPEKGDCCQEAYSCSDESLATPCVGQRRMWGKISRGTVYCLFV